MTRPITFALTVTLLLASTYAAAQQPEVYRPDPSPPKSVTLNAPVTVPLLPSQVGRAPLPVVEVTINGRGPFRLGVETGANFIAVSPDVVTQLGLVRAGGPDDYPEYRADSVRIGGAVFQDMPISAEGRATGVDGLLGLPFWAGVLLTIDYPANQLTISHDTLPAPDTKSIVPLTRTADFWSLPLLVAGQPTQGILDTRSTGGFGFTPDAAAPLSFTAPPIVIGRARGAAIAETEVKGGQISGNIVIGRYLIPQPFIEIRALPPGFPQVPLIGARVLSHFVVSLDQRTARLRLVHAAGDTVTLPVPRMGPAPR
ncbi:MAG: retropepsin-like aspartic protease [Gemmatimonadota bacterium]